jgi:UDP-glucose 4-epimerase
MMAAYVVTGGCGMIGSHLCEALLNRGDRVRILDDLSTGSLAHKPSGAELIRGDIRDRDAVALAMVDMDGCFHLAAIASVERANRQWIETHTVNLTGTITVFDVARQAGDGRGPLPVVYASSAAIYGDQGADAIAETARPAPLSAYGSDKLACEYHARVASIVHGVPTAGLRFFNVYGQRQDPQSPYSGVISIFCDRIARGEQIEIMGDGLQTRDFIYVADAVRALILTMERISAEPVAFNVCTGRPTSVLDLAAVIAKLCGNRPRFVFREPRRGEIRHSLGDLTSARDRLGFQASESLESGLAKSLGIFG